MVVILVHNKTIEAVENQHVIFFINLSIRSIVNQANESGIYNKLFVCEIKNKIFSYEL